MYHNYDVPRILLVLVGCLTTFNVVGMTCTNAVFKSDSIERLMRVAARENGIYTTFNPYLGDHGSIAVDVTGLGCMGGEFATFSGCITRLSNESDMTFKLSSLPSGIQGVEFLGGQFDLSAIPPCEEVKYFSARCSDLFVNVPTLCALFPHVEIMILDISGQNDIDLYLDCLLRMKSLRRLELRCHGHKGPIGKDKLRKFLKSLPRLERCELSLCCDLEKENRGGIGKSKYHTFEISDSIENNSEGVVDVPDWGEFTDITLRMYSPTVREVEFRPSSNTERAAFLKMHSLTLDLHNVVPLGESSLINDGVLRYDIHIDKTMPIENGFEDPGESEP